MPKPVSQFVQDYVSGRLDRAEALCDWRKLTDAQFRKKWRVDGETARRCMGSRNGVPANFRSKCSEFERRYSTDARARKDWASLTVKGFVKAYGYSWRVAEAVFGPRPHGQYGLNRTAKKWVEPRTWVDDYRDARKREEEEARSYAARCEEACGDSYSHPIGNAVGFVGSVNIRVCI